MTLLTGMSRLLLTGYVLAFVFLNLLAYLISSFYQKKFDQPSPRTGFILAVALAVLYIACLFLGSGAPRGWRVVQMLVLFGSAIASASSAMALYYTMKRVRK
ncbi:MAG: hypothetical protein GF418_16080 [Chitinivibrionales bacterium]|nr:hypothetical protein [Chitinivibrionales bacterium]MBD3397140.1 hypothetical protein [Chitinivibrionales bacterium]